MRPNPAAPIDIVIPVYQGFAVTRRCLDSVLDHRQEFPHEVIVIDDASPSSELADYLDGLARAGRITLLRNSANQGFVVTANRGLALHPDRDVVLLNSDTEVNGDWLDRLARCARAAATTGTVTPFSNNATICSYPIFCEPNELPPGLSLAATDALFRNANSGRWLEIPTAVGFCMYIRRDCLREVGCFDEQRFGLGYGEENDFCMRAGKVGWHHVLCADTYIYHVGGASFGERQQQLQIQARNILAELHPDYDERIQGFIRQDPVKPFRVAVDRERAVLSSQHALSVLREHDREFEVRERRGRQTEQMVVALERGLRNAERLVAQIQDELRYKDQALAEAQRYAREREADVNMLGVRLQAFQDDLERTVRRLEELRDENQELRRENEDLRQRSHCLAAQLGEIHASRIWRYTEFLRKS